MKIISFNANGLRSASTKGFFYWVKKQNPDVICIQETKMQTSQLNGDCKLDGYQQYFFDAEKKGYSGVAIYTKHTPLDVRYGLGFELCDTEGRYVEVTLPQNIKVASLYLPSGTSGDHRQEQKYKFLDLYEQILQKQISSQEKYIVCGDWNIAHENIDIKNWRSNQKKSGFLPEERSWLTKIMKDMGWIDAFRYLYKDKVAYTWWSNRANAWANDVGWRIDYQMITPNLKNAIKSMEVYRGEKFSDHAPLIGSYDLS